MDMPRKWVNSCVKGKSKPFPLVMLVNCQNIIHPSHPKAPALKMSCLSLPNEFRFINTEVNDNKLSENQVLIDDLQV